MSHKNAKKIRKALFQKGIPANTEKYVMDTRTGTIYASPERRIYRALKKQPIDKAIKLIAKLKPGRRKA